MKKLLATLVLAGVAGLMVAGSDSTLAQAKKAAAKNGTIELVESKDGKYRFTVRDADGKYLGGSTVGHATEKEAKAAVEELKTVLATAAYVSKKSDDAKTDKDAKPAKDTKPAKDK